MITPRESRRRRLAWFDALAVILVAGYLAGLVLLARAAQPGVHLPGPLTAYTRPDDPWPITAQVALGTGAFLAYWWPRRDETRSFSLLASVSLAVSTLVLGIASYWTCTSGQAPFWTPLTRAVNLVVGGVNDSCGFPLALQTARLLGPLLLVVTALGVLATLFRSQRDRLSVRLGRQVVLVVGLAPDTLGLIRRLALDRPRGTVVAVVADAADSGLIRAVRRAGARVVPADPADPSALEVLLTRRHRLKVSEAHLLAGDTAHGLRWVSALRDLATRCERTTSCLAPRLLVRIDDPWQAEYWRRGNTYQRSPERAGVAWMCDAISPAEITARLLVHRLQQGFHDRVALVGASPLALAVCAELVQSAREEALLVGRDRPLVEGLVLVGPSAHRVARLHDLWQLRFGQSVQPLSVSPGADVVSGLEQALSGARRPAVVIADDGGSGVGSSELAVTHPRWTVFARSATTRGVAVAPVMEGLLPFGLTTELPADWPLDSWERAARVVHEQYRRHAPPEAAANRPWAGLERFVQESNIRLVTTTLGSMEAIGRSWLPQTATERGADSSVPDLTADQLTRLAELEHESWLQHLTENGWRWGPRREDRRRTHPALRSWSRLAEADRVRTVDNVRGAVATLGALGYHSAPVVRSGATWRRFVRSGEVQATRSTVAWTWRTSSGALLRAEEGDWRVSDGEEVWSVVPEVFASTYEQVRGDRWRRVGEVSGRPATRGEIITSLEGAQTATDDEWVLRGEGGEQWLVTSRHLAAHYAPVAIEAHSSPDGLIHDRLLPKPENAP